MKPLLTARLRPLVLAGLGAALLLGCDGTAAPEPMGPPVPVDPMEMGGGPMPDPVPEVTCSGEPAAGTKQPWRHGIKSPATLLLGSPRHRGIDLVAGATSAVQRLRGTMSYGSVDKALEDEQVDVFGCRAGAWRPLGSALTDDEGRFELALMGDARLPIGQRQLFASVAGDRTGVGFLGLVLPAGSRLAFSDIDGTLTSSENAYPESLLTGAAVGVHDGAKEALAALRQRRYHLVYLTARGQVFTEDTRRWLQQVGLPVGPLRLAPQVITLPGDATVDYKAGTMGEITATGLTIFIGIGNRKSDAEAYKRVAVLPQDIFLKQPEYQGEIDPLIARGDAVGFDSYRALVPVFSTLPLAP